MKEPKEIKGMLYSKEEFEGYKFRAKVEIVTNTNQEINFDLYTTNTNRNSAFNHLLHMITARTSKIRIVHWTSKEQDDLTTKFIDETLSNDEFWANRHRVKELAEMDNQPTDNWDVMDNY